MWSTSSPHWEVGGLITACSSLHAKYPCKCFRVEKLYIRTQHTCHWVRDTYSVMQTNMSLHSQTHAWHFRSKAHLNNSNSHENNKWSKPAFRHAQETLNSESYRFFLWVLESKQRWKVSGAIHNQIFQKFSSPRFNGTHDPNEEVCGIYQ